MNAIDSMPAMIRFIAVPLISFGMSDNSDSSTRLRLGMTAPLYEVYDGTA